MARPYPTGALSAVASIERHTVKPEQIRPDDLYVGLENIDSDGKFSLVGHVEPGELKSNKFRFGPRHVLYGKLRPYLSKIARPDFGGICSTDILPIRPGPELFGPYLHHFLRTPAMVDHASSLATGINLPRLSPKALSSFQIPLPPIEEQRRIAAVLDAADELRSKRRQVLAKLDTLTQAIFIDMFGDCPSEVPLSDLCDMDNGMNFSADDRGDGSKGCLMLDVKNMYSAGISPDFSTAYRVDIDVPERRLLQEGDMVFVRSSVKREGVAWPAYFDGHDEPVAFCGFIIRGRLNSGSSESFLPEFLVHFLRQPDVRMRAIASSGQVAITNVSQKRLGELKVASPPMDRQWQFKSRLAEIDLMRAHIESSHTELDTLFASLQQRAFAGEL